MGSGKKAFFKPPDCHVAGAAAAAEGREASQPSMPAAEARGKWRDSPTSWTRSGWPAGDGLAVKYFARYFQDAVCTNRGHFCGLFEDSGLLVG